MNKAEIDQLIISIQHQTFMWTIDACAHQWGMDFKGKDKDKLYPPMPMLPDTQEEVVKAIKAAKINKE